MSEYKVVNTNVQGVKINTPTSTNEVHTPNVNLSNFLEEYTADINQGSFNFAAPNIANERTTVVDSYPEGRDVDIEPSYKNYETGKEFNTSKGVNEYSPTINSSEANSFEAVNYFDSKAYNYTQENSIKLENKKDQTLAPVYQWNIDSQKNSIEAYKKEIQALDENYKKESEELGKQTQESIKKFTESLEAESAALEKIHTKAEEDRLDSFRRGVDNLIASATEEEKEVYNKGEGGALEEKIKEISEKYKQDAAKEEAQNAKENKAISKLHKQQLKEEIKKLEEEEEVAREKLKSASESEKESIKGKITDLKKEIQQSKKSLKEIEKEIKQKLRVQEKAEIKEQAKKHWDLQGQALADALAAYTIKPIEGLEEISKLDKSKSWQDQDWGKIKNVIKKQTEKALEDTYKEAWKTLKDGYLDSIKSLVSLKTKKDKTQLSGEELLKEYHVNLIKGSKEADKYRSTINPGPTIGEPVSLENSVMPEWSTLNRYLDSNFKDESSVFEALMNEDPLLRAIQFNLHVYSKRKNEIKLSNLKDYKIKNIEFPSYEKETENVNYGGFSLQVIKDTRSKVTHIATCDIICDPFLNQLKDLGLQSGSLILHKGSPISAKVGKETKDCETYNLNGVFQKSNGTIATKDEDYQNESIACLRVLPGEAVNSEAMQETWETKRSYGVDGKSTVSVEEVKHLTFWLENFRIVKIDNPNFEFNSKANTPFTLKATFSWTRMTMCMEDRSAVKYY